MAWHQTSWPDIEHPGLA